MHRIDYIAIFTACFWNCIDCQGGGGGGGGGGSSGGSRYYSHNSNSGSGGGCQGENCRQGGLIALACLLVATGVFVLVYLLCYCNRGRPSKDHAAFVNSGGSATMPQEQEMHETKRNVSQMEGLVTNVFQSGIWTGRYFQYGDWHGPYEMILNFDRQSIIAGWGTDDVGKFTVKGVYSRQTGRIGLTKTYQAGTGNVLENLGHEVKIQLTKNSRSQKFEGKWYVKTSNYGGEDKFELSFDRPYHHEEV